MARGGGKVAVGGWLSVCILLAAGTAGAAAVWPTPVIATAVIVLAAVAVRIIARRPRRDDVSVPLGAMTGIVLCYAVPQVLVWATPSPGRSSWIGPAITTAACGLRLAWLVYRGEQRLAESMVWTFSYVFLGLAPLVQARLHEDPGTTLDIHHALDTATFWAVIVGLAAFMVGVLLGGRGHPAAEYQMQPIFRRQRLILLSLASLAVSLYYIAAVGLPWLFASRVDLSARVAQVWSNPTTAAVASAGASMPLLVFFVALIQRRKTGRRSTLYGVLLPAALLIILLTVVNPISSPRFVLGTVVLAVLTVFGLAATRSRFRALILGTVAGLLLLFPLADAFRTSTSAAGLQFQPVQSLLTGDFDAYDQINNALLYVSQEGTTNGRQALGVALFWVPRSLWSTKPVDTGVLLAQYRGYRFTNLSAPLWAELLINGGWVLLILGMFAFGWLIRRWDNRTVTILRIGSSPGLLACILPFYMLILLRGSLLQATAMLVVITLCGWLVRDLHREAARRERAMDGSGRSLDAARQLEIGAAVGPTRSPAPGSRDGVACSAMDGRNYILGESMWRPDR